jgi:hypothetical protein
MLPLTASPSRLCSGPSRREVLRLGAVTPAALTLPTLLAAESRGADAPRSPRRAKSCLLVFMEGGPSHIDLWDMKPDAPAEVRGEFQPIQTRTPGVTVCEHLPLSAPLWHHLAQVRSVRHGVNDHNAGSYYMLSGHSPFEGSKLVVADSPQNFPPIGAVLAKYRPVDRPIPAFVHVPEYQWNNGVDIAGQSAGFLGAAYDPFVSGDPSLKGYSVPGLDLLPEVPLDRLGARDDLRKELDRAVARLGDSPALDRMTVFQRKAVEIITSPETRRAFDLSREPAKVRERYGLDPGSNRSIEARKFGGLPHLGQCMLLSRRLIEAGVRLVTLMTGRKIDQAWDTHRDHFPLLKKSLLPPFDRAFSALLQDFLDRGLFEDTLLVVMGEFGRTPKLGYITSDAGADRNGRDHWPYCYTVFFAGAGVKGGAVFGASDRTAAYPKEHPVGPEDVAATVYAALGIDPATEIRDGLDRPYTLCTGRPIAGVLR